MVAMAWRSVAASVASVAFASTAPHPAPPGFWLHWVSAAAKLVSALRTLVWKAIAAARDVAEAKYGLRPTLPLMPLALGLSWTSTWRRTRGTLTPSDSHRVTPYSSDIGTRVTVTAAFAVVPPRLSVKPDSAPAVRSALSTGRSDGISAAPSDPSASLTPSGARDPSARRSSS